jgi:hypothetical protein
MQHVPLRPRHLLSVSLMSPHLLHFAQLVALSSLQRRPPSPSSSHRHHRSRRIVLPSHPLPSSPGHLQRQPGERLQHHRLPLQHCTNLLLQCNQHNMPIPQFLRPLNPPLRPQGPTHVSPTIVRRLNPHSTSFNSATAYIPQVSPQVSASISTSQLFR